MLQNFIEKEHIGTLLKNVSLKTKTSFRIGGTAKYFIEVSSVLALIKLIKFLKENNLKYFVIGKGTNLLFSDEYFDTIFISLNKLNKSFKITSDKYFVEAGCCSIKFGKNLVKLGFKDAIHLALIPGTIGGMVYMNASAFNHSMKDIVYKVMYLTKDGILKSITSSFDFDYRTSIFQTMGVIIVGVYLHFKIKNEETQNLYQKCLNIKKTTQPINSYNAGSIFRNLKDIEVWKLIDALGFRGYVIGGAKVSNIHTNFFINFNHSSFNEMYQLIYFVKRKVEEKFQIKLTPEIKIITKNNISPLQKKELE